LKWLDVKEQNLGIEESVENIKPLILAQFSSRVGIWRYHTRQSSCFLLRYFPRIIWDYEVVKRRRPKVEL
jgi:hypothetical protein